MNKTMCMAAAAGMAFAGGVSADSDWATATSGNYTLAANWSPANVPDTALELATIAVGPGAYTVTLPAGPTFSIAGLVLSNPAAMLDIEGGRSLRIAGGVFTVDGTVRIDSNNSSADAVLAFDTNTSFNGSGVLRLNRNVDARLETGPAALLSNNAIIEGGGIIHAALANAGLVRATSGGVLELVTNDKSNTGIIRAEAGGRIDFDVEIENTGGLIEAVDGTVRSTVGSPSIIGGTLHSTGTGNVLVVVGSDLTLDGVTNTGRIDVEGAGDVLVSGGLHNDGLMVIDSNNSSSDAILTFVESGSLSGSGIVRLNRNLDARFESDPGVTVTVAASQRIEGGGLLGAAVVNNGTIEAHVAGGVIDLYDHDKFNNGLIRATNGGIIDLTGVTTTQSGPGVIRGDGGTLRVGTGDTAIEGGLIHTLNGGILVAHTGAMLSLTNVSLTGPINLEGGSTLLLTSTLANNGLITVDSNNSSVDAVLTTVNDVTINGTGNIILNRNFDARMDSAPGTVLTLGPGQTVSGGGLINARLVNNGIVEATNPGAAVELRTEPKVNNHIMRANPGATLNISTVTTTQGPGASISTDSGVILANSASPTRIEGGSLVTTGTGAVRVLNPANLEVLNVAFSGLWQIEGNGTVTVDSVLTNNGMIVVDSNNSALDAFVTTAGDALINGAGTIRLNRHPDARMTTPEGATMTLGAGQVVDGSGVINARLVNNGVIDANVFGGIIGFADHPKLNNNIMRATAGLLDITGVSITQAPGGVILAADGGQVRVNFGSPTRVEGGSLRSEGSGFARLTSAADLTLSGLVADAVIQLEGNALLTVENTVINDGEVRVNTNNSAVDAVVQAADGSTIAGAGSVRLLRGGLDSQLVADGSATIGTDQTVFGVGTLNGEWLLRGTLAPGLSVGAIANEGTLNMTPQSHLAIEIASQAGNGFDRVTGAGAVHLDGALDISFDGYIPVKNHAFRIVNGSSVTGTFESINGPALSGGLVYAIVYDPTFAELRITCGPDLNLDGLLDFFDVQFFLQAFSAQEPIGDFNEDGLFDFFDVQAFLNAFSLGCP